MRKIISLTLALSMLVSFALPMTIGASANNGVVLSVSEATGEAGDIVDVFVNVNADSGIVAITVSLEFDDDKLEFQNPTGSAANIRNAFTVGTLTEGLVSMFSRNYDVANSKVLVSATLDEEIFAAGQLLKFRFLIKDGWSGDSPVALIQAETVLKDDDIQNIPFSTVAGKVSVPLPTYQITFDANGGEGGAVQTVSEGDIPVPPTVTRTGYTFEGWSPTIAPATADATYTAQWTKVVTLSVSDASGGVGDIVDVFVNVDAGSGIVAITVSLEFDDDKLEFQNPTGSAANIRNAFTVGTLTEGLVSMFSRNYDEANSKVLVSATLDEEIFAAGQLLKFRFLIKDGWTGDTPVALIQAETVLKDDDIQNIPFTTVPGKVTFVAVTYQITFNANGGTGGEVQTVNQGTVPTPPTVSRPGYTFNGWTPTIVAATADATYTAQWTVNAYQITFDANGGEGGEVVNANYGTVPVPPVVTREGYSFAGWTPDIVEATEDATYTAQWTINEYTITLDANGGTIPVGSITQEFGTQVSNPPDPIRTGYYFTGWNPTVPTVMPAENTTCVAQWVPNSYSLAFDANGGTGSMAPQSIDFDATSALNPNEFTYVGRTFAGWNTAADGSGDAYADGADYTMTTEGATLYAQWALNTFQITFNANGGTGGAVLTVPYGTVPVPPVVEREGYSFIDWEPTPVVEATQDATYTAQWEINTYDAIFMVDGEVYATVPTQFGATIVPPADPEKPGFTFDKWDPVPGVMGAGDETFVAVFIADITYQITFDPNGGTVDSGVAVQTVNEGEMPVPPVVSKEGYTFTGWTPDLVAASEDATYTAQWAINTYQIVFDAAGGEGGTTVTVEHGETPVAPTVTREGYTFTGWSEPIVPATSVKTYYAQWAINTYNAIFMVDGEVYETVPTQFGATIVAPADPDKVGHTFTGWDPVPGMMGAADETFIAQFTIHTFQITFNANGGEGGEVQTVNYGTIPTPPTVIREGYTFNGWTPTIVAATADATYTAQWEAITYQITFDADGGEGGEVQTVDYGTVPTPPTVTREGYTFNGWTPTIVAAIADATYTAQWTILTYQITFDANGGEGGEVQTVDYGTIPTPPTVTQEGFTFNGWTPAIVAATADATYTAQWLINYTVTFNSNGGTEVDPIIVPFGGTIDKPEPDPTKANHTFAGWFWDEGLTNEVQWPITVPDDQPALETKASAQNTNPQLEIVLYAAWTLNSYEIDFFANGGTFVSGEPVQTVPHGTVPVAPVVTRVGYTFAGWTPDIVEATEDATYTAQWEAITYQITFDANGGEGGEVKTVDYGTVPTPPTVTRDGYTFMGWTPEIVAATADATYTAQWEEILMSTITFNTDGGTAIAPISGVVGSPVTPPADPTKEGYTFKGWEPELPDEFPQQDLVVVALWEEIPVVTTYTITFELVGGTVVSGEAVQTVEEGTTPVPPVVTKEGFTFVEWTPAIVAATADATYTAVWEEIPVGQTTITFNTAGGSAVAPITGDIGSAVTAPADPTREGYTFMGWSPALPETFPAEDMEVTALWTVNTYYAIFMVDGVEYAKVPVDFGGVITPPEAPEKDGYLFAGWDNIPDTMPANDVVINALFTEDGVPQTGSHNAVAAAMVLLAVSVATLSAARIAKKEDDE